MADRAGSSAALGLTVLLCCAVVALGDIANENLGGRRMLWSLKGSFPSWFGVRSMLRRPAVHTVAKIPRTVVVPSLRYMPTVPYACGKSYNWDSFGSNSAFYTFLCIDVSGIHVVQTRVKSIIITDRSDSNNTYYKLPPDYTQNAYAEEVLFSPGFPRRPLDVKSNVFCSAGQILQDGTMLSIGGASDASSADPMLNGSFSIRSFSPCTDGTCDFVLLGDMTSKRWYPTAQFLPDGRVLIVGGANVYGNIAINDMGKNNPSIEYWPRAKGEGNYTLQFLIDTVPFNLYPFVHVLKSGLVFIFAGNSWTLFNTTSNQEVPGPLPDGSYPPLDVVDATGQPVMRQYPVSGTDVVFPLSSAKNYTSEIMICGGNNVKAIYISGDRRTSTQVNNKIWADDMCWRITPDSPNPTWVGQRMCLDPQFINTTISTDGDASALIPCQYPLKRVMGDAVILADGSVLILNGAQQGYQGLSQIYANTPQKQPLLYYPSNHSFSPFALAPSKLSRMYHSTAILLHDASVFVAGSNPNEYLSTKGTFPTEFRSEIFAPPYLFTAVTRPTLLSATKSVAVNSLFSITFSYNATQSVGVAPMKRFTVALIHPGFSTHNQRHSQRYVVLDIAAFTNLSVVNGTATALTVVKSPPNLNIAPPTEYWLHVLDSGVPNKEGLPLVITPNLAYGLAAY